jgi:hypothetical protein
LALLGSLRCLAQARKNMIAEVRRRLHQAPGVARGAHATAFAGIGHKTIPNTLNLPQNNPRKNMSLLDKAKELATTVAATVTDKATDAGHAVAAVAESAIAKASEAGQAVSEAAGSAAAKAGEVAQQAGTSLASGASALAGQAGTLASRAVEATKSAGAAGLSAAEKVTGIDFNKDGKIG